jgi:hypothetical protein
MMTTYENAPPVEGWICEPREPAPTEDALPIPANIVLGSD